MEANSQTCPHCNAGNLVAQCRQDARAFVLTTAHREGRRREFDDGPIQQLPEGLEVALCDFCSAKAAGLGPAAAVEAGMRQRTCPACHGQFV